MKRLVLSCLAFVTIGLLTTGMATAGQASCLVRLQFEPARLPLNYATVTMLLQSNGVLYPLLQNDPTFSDIMRDEDYATVDYVDARFAPAGGMLGQSERLGGGPMVAAGAQVDGQSHGVLFGALIVEVDGVPHAEAVAARLLPAICERLQTVLQEVSKADEARFERRLAQAQQELVELAARADQLQIERQALRDALGRPDLDSDAVLMAVQGLHRERGELELELAARRARQEALLAQVAEIGESLEERVADNPVLAELSKVVELRETALKRARQLVDAGTASVEEANQMAEALARARAEFAQQREVAVERAGAGVVHEVHRELRGLEVEMAEAEGRLRAIRERLDEINGRGLLEITERLEGDIRERLTDTQRARHDAADQIRRLERELLHFEPPAITVLGLDGGD